MKSFTIAFKDLFHTFRSPFSLVMMFVAPLLITGLLYFAFGSLTGDSKGITVPRTRVEVANLDRAGEIDAGQMMVDFLQNSDLEEVMDVSVIKDEVSARSAVDHQDAGVAIIIPPDFSQAVLDPEHEASVVLYQDPTLSIGPSIVKDLINHFLDGSLARR